jgi:hypothetical protein
VLSLTLRDKHVSITPNGEETVAVARRHTIEVFPFRSGELAKYLKGNQAP